MYQPRTKEVVSLFIYQHQKLGRYNKIGICIIRNNHFWLYFKDLNVKLGNQAHQKIQLNIPDWNETKMDNIDTSGIDAKMSLYLDLLNKKVVL